MSMKLLETMEVLVALTCKSWHEVKAAADAGEEAPHSWLWHFDGTCCAMKTVFPDAHSRDEAIDEAWADRVLAAADPAAVEYVRGML